MGPRIFMAAKGTGAGVVGGGLGGPAGRLGPVGDGGQGVLYRHRAGGRGRGPVFALPSEGVGRHVDLKGFPTVLFGSFSGDLPASNAHEGSDALRPGGGRGGRAGRGGGRIQGGRGDAGRRGETRARQGGGTGSGAGRRGGFGMGGIAGGGEGGGNRAKQKGRAARGLGAGGTREDKLGEGQPGRESLLVSAGGGHKRGEPAGVAGVRVARRGGKERNGGRGGGDGAAEGAR